MRLPLRVHRRKHGNTDTCFRKYFPLVVTMKAATANSITFLFLQLFSSILLPVTGDLPLTHSPDHVFAVSGKDVTLHIHPTTSVYRVTTVEWSRVDGPSPLTVHVERHGKELMKEKAAEYLGRTALMNDGSLMLHNVTQQDSGKYRCVLLRGPATEVEVFFSLIVGEVPEVNFSLQRTSANEIFLHWESRDSSLKPQISLLDGKRKDLPAEMAQTESLTKPGDLYSVRAHVNAAAAKETGIIICRVDLPGTSVVKETQISIKDEFHPLDSSLESFVVPVIAFMLGVVLAVGFLPFLSLEMIKNLQLLLRGFFGGKGGNPDAPQLFILNTDYGDITKVDTTGSSKPLISHGRQLFRVEASHELARRDLEGMNAYKDKIISAANECGIHPATIAGIISRQSQFGATLRPDGYGHTDSSCFGLMQINRLYHIVQGGPYDEDHLKQGASILVECFKIMAREKPDWTKEHQLKGALACYIAGEDRVLPLSYKNVDSETPYGDFANDVVARAQWFAQNAF